MLLQIKLVMRRAQIWLQKLFSYSDEARAGGSDVTAASKPNHHTWFTWFVKFVQLHRAVANTETSNFSLESWWWVELESDRTQKYSAGRSKDSSVESRHSRITVRSPYLILIWFPVLAEENWFAWLERLYNVVVIRKLCDGISDG